MRGQLCYITAWQSFAMYSAWNPTDNYDMSASVFVVQFNGFMSLTRQVADACECGNEPSGSVKCGEFLD